MTEIQSALGRRLLQQADDSLARRRELATQLQQGLAGVCGLRLAWPGSDVEHAFYRYFGFVQPQRLRPGWTRNRILQAIEAEGVPCYTGSCPELYREKVFAAFQPANRLPVAAELGETSLCFLVHPTISDADIRDTIAAVRKVMEHATI